MKVTNLENQKARKASAIRLTLNLLGYWIRHQAPHVKVSRKKSVVIVNAYCNVEQH